MADLMDPLACYNKAKDRIMAIPNDKHAVMNMPIDEGMQEGKRVAAVVEKYGDKLAQSDIDPEYLRSVSTRAGAFAYSVAQMDAFVKVGQNNFEKYQAMKKEGYALRARIMDKYEYAFRKDPAVLTTLATIREGRGDLDMIRDLLSLHKLGTDCRDRVGQAKVDFSLIERAHVLYKELSNLTSDLDIDPKRVEESKRICSKAWTYLWEALDEIYLAGRFVFDDQPEIEELFYIDYRQKIAKKAAAQDGPAVAGEPAVGA